MNKLNLHFFVAFSVVLAMASFSEALEPFDNWANVPGWYAVDYPVYYDVDRLTDKDGRALPLPDLKMSLTRNVFRGTFYNKSLLSKSILLSAYIPYDRLQLLGQSSSGIGDMTLVAGYFPYDSDAPKSAFGIGILVDAPTGKYEPNKSVNVGTNIWNFRPVLSYARLFGGMVNVEASVKYNFATENSYTGLKNGNKLIVETYNGAFLARWLLVGGHFNYNVSADNKLYGQPLSDTGIQVFQAGGSVTLMPTQTTCVVLEILRDLGSKNFTEGTLYLSRISWKFL